MQTQQPTALPQLNDAEKALIKQYVTSLKERGFCKIDDSTSNQTRLFNRYTGDTLYSTFIQNDFNKWCYSNNHDITYPGPNYIMLRLVHVVGHKFDPLGGIYSTDAKSGLCYVNICKKYEPASIECDVSPLWNEFWERLIADPLQRHQALQWIAHIFQRPYERPSYHLMWPSDPGTGKGFLIECILQPLLLHTEVAASYSKVMDRFSTMLETSYLVLLDDCKTSSDATQTRLKSILSEERQHVERKHAQGKMVRSYTRFILASNEARPLYLDPDERRWLVFDRLVHRVDGAETQQFIARLDAWLKTEGALDKVFNWFMKYDLSGFNHKRAPESKALQAMVALSVNPHEEFTAGFIRDNIVFTLKELQDAFLAEGLPKANPSHVPHIMSKLGYTKSQIQFDGKRSMYYYPMGVTPDQVQGLCNSRAKAVQEADKLNPPF
ncbi:DUF5906 domain-containing protein [Massilia sp.]|uniref:primase-helicase family protein n=1 Tax=Massilia sp. TaxID=1882437 RepID=UPI002899070A|nr:DUF5906 domain-containing protein [Massilia sp.]